MIELQMEDIHLSVDPKRGMRKALFFKLVGIKRIKPSNASNDSRRSDDLRVRHRFKYKKVVVGSCRFDAVIE